VAAWPAAIPLTCSPGKGGGEMSKIPFHVEYSSGNVHNADMGNKVHISIEPAKYGIELGYNRLGVLGQIETKVSEIVKEKNGTTTQNTSSVHVSLEGQEGRDAASILAAVILLRQALSELPSGTREKVERMLRVAVKLTADAASLGAMSWLGATVKELRRRQDEASERGTKADAQYAKKPDPLKAKNEEQKAIIRIYQQCMSVLPKPTSLRDRKTRDQEVIGRIAEQFSRSPNHIRKVCKAYRLGIIIERTGGS
jgi:hypothetical protein